MRVVFPESNVSLIAVMSLTTSEWTLLMTGTFVSGDTAALLARVHQFIHTSILWLIRNILKVWKHKPFKQLSKDPEGPRSTQKHPEGKLIRQISQPQSFQAGFITILMSKLRSATAGCSAGYLSGHFCWGHLNAARRSFLSEAATWCHAAAQWELSGQ